jgi:type I restriction enzyme S subunit
MLRGWKRCELGDVLTFQRGFDLPQRDRQEGNIPIVSSSGISGYHNLAKVHGPGVVTGRYGTLGQVFYIKKDFWPLNTTLFVREFRGNDPLFLSYFLRTLNLANQNAAGAVPGLNRNALHLLPICIPPFPTQRKIAAILSAYDDLIENNTRRIAILEEMAQVLYREWFVHFRYPGHEKNGTVESALGMIPDGWEVKSIGDVVITLGGGTPSTINPEYWDDGNVIWYSPTDLTSSGKMFITDSAKKITKMGLQQSSARLFPAYSVMMTSRATIGVVAINTKQACTNQGFITCIPNASLSAYQMYFWLVENKEKIISIASGATFKEINRTTFRGLPIVIPNASISQQFNEMVSPVGKQIENLITKNANLRGTRDLLLPKLISGEVDVEGLDIETGEGMSEAVASIEEDVKKSAEAALAGEQMMLWG